MTERLKSGTDQHTSPAAGTRPGAKPSRRRVLAGLAAGLSAPYLAGRVGGGFLSPAAAQSITDTVPLVTEIVTEEIGQPWGLDFLPGGDFLVTEKDGRLMRVAANGSATPLSGLPRISSIGQGGLLDVLLDPDFERNQKIYLSYAGQGSGGASTEVASAVLDGDRVRDFTVLFAASPKTRGGFHFGCRLAFDKTGKLVAGLGDRGRMEESQNTQSHTGTLIRINTDGSVPDDNPFVGNEAFLPEILSYGHRNVQGLARHPVTQDLWAHEHGPQGGDEVNLIVPGTNYGWPRITYGIDYDNSIISNRTEAPGMAQPLLHWTPSIAPCGMAFYEGDAIPQWRNSLFVGSLKMRRVHRLTVTDDAITDEEILFEDRGDRIRDVNVGPDGALYLLTDTRPGTLIRVRAA